jgi:hypothetical protein
MLTRTLIKQPVRLALILGGLTLSSFGATSVATVTSGVAFTLDGQSINTPGVTSFPVVSGDTISTSSGPAIILFKDGSVVKLSANSSVKVDGEVAEPKVVLTAGALDFKLVAGSKISVTNLDGKHSEPLASDNGATNSGSRLGSVLGSSKFLIPASGAAIGAGTALFYGLSSGSSAAAGSPSVAPIAQVAPVSKHL